MGFGNPYKDLKHNFPPNKINFNILRRNQKNICNTGYIKYEINVLDVTYQLRLELDTFQLNSIYFYLC